MNENDFFRPEKVEEQIDQLTQQVSKDPGELQSAHLIAALQHIYQQEEARESVARVKQRIEGRNVMEEGLRDGRESGRIVRPYDMSKRERMGGNKTGKIVGMPRLLSIIAAVLIVGMIVGSWIVVARMAANHAGRTPSSQNKHADNVYIGGKQIVYKLNGDTGAIMWQRKLSTGGAIQIKMLGTVIYAIQNSDIYALNGQDGSLRWHKHSTNDIYTTVIAQNDMLYLSGNYQPDKNHISILFLALNTRNGSERWRNTTINTEFSDSFTLQNGAIYVRGYNRDGLNAIDAATGTLRWHILEKFDTPGLDLAPLVANSIVYDVYGNYLYALDEKTGVQLWHKQLASDKNYFSSAKYYNGNIMLNFMLSPERHPGLYDYQPQISVINARTGTTRWTSPTGYTSLDNTHVIDGLIFATNHDQGTSILNALDANSGKMRWQYKESCLPTDGSCFIWAERVDGILYVFESKGIVKNTVFGFDIQTGKKLFQNAVNISSSSYTQPVHDRIYFTSNTLDQPNNANSSTFTITFSAYQLSKGVVLWQYKLTKMGDADFYTNGYGPVVGQ